MTSASGRSEAYGSEQISLAYARLAMTYDYVFGPVLNRSRLAAVSAVNALPGTQVLEVGVGTGLALPYYRADKRITGIDLAPEMLRIARKRAARLRNVEALLEMDVQSMIFDDNRFDIAAVMFVASVVPQPRILMAELSRVVKSEGRIIIVNHFATDRKLISWIERVMAPVCIKLGWRADFRLDDLLRPAELESSSCTPLPPLGLFHLLKLQNNKAPRSNVIIHPDIA
jgi:phosphatidylethanolamine/phosphatidyl-N-methylethanolamine N-methyltransferase